MKTDITVAALGIPSNITVTIITMSNNQCMQKIPSWEANSCSATHSIPCLLQNTSVRYYFHNSLTHTLSLFPLAHPPSVLTHILHCTTSLLTLQCRVTSAARHSENISCSGVTSAARHGARSHSFVYISTTSGANVIGLLRACSWRSWLSYGVGNSC